jgi:AcrR family transcriptional regulator
MADEAAAGSGVDLRNWRLPRGRHGLPRELVVRSQRERLLAAVVRVTAAKGYEATTVGDILTEAGVGRESFYELFEDKRDCMLAAHTILINHLEARVGVAYAGEAAWPDRLREALAAALDWFAEDPDVARFTLIELAAVGPASRRRFRADYNRFVALLAEGLEDDGPQPELPNACALAVGAMLAKIYEVVVRERTAGLPALLPELTYEVLVPFVGEEHARAERARAEAI